MFLPSPHPYAQSLTHMPHTPAGGFALDPVGSCVQVTGRYITTKWCLRGLFGLQCAEGQKTEWGQGTQQEVPQHTWLFLIPFPPHPKTEDAVQSPHHMLISIPQACPCRLPSPLRFPPAILTSLHFCGPVYIPGNTSLFSLLCLWAESHMKPSDPDGILIFKNSGREHT